MTREQMIHRIDLVADTIRNVIVGDPVRAFEYKQAELDARAFQSNNYQGEVPSTVQSWVNASGLTIQDATDNIIHEANLFNMLLLKIREYRLMGKAMIKNAASDATAEVEFNIYINKLKELLPT